VAVSICEKSQWPTLEESNATRVGSYKRLERLFRDKRFSLFGLIIGDEDKVKLDT